MDDRLKNDGRMKEERRKSLFIILVILFITLVAYHPCLNIIVGANNINNTEHQSRREHSIICVKLKYSICLCPGSGILNPNSKES